MVVLDWDGNVLHRESFGYAGPFLLCEGEGENGDDKTEKPSQGDLPLDDKPKDEPKPETVSKADYDALKANFDSLSGEIRKLQKNSSAKNDKDRIAKGEAEKLLEEKAARLEAIEAKLEGYQKRDEDRANDLLGKLPDEVRDRLKPFKDKLETGDWLALLEAEAETHIDNSGGGSQSGGNEGGDQTPTPPSTGSVMGAGGKKKRELSDTAKTILAEMMREPKYEEKLDLQKEDNKPLKSKFTRPVKDFFDDMRKAKPVKFTRSEGEKRLG